MSASIPADSATVAPRDVGSDQPSLACRNRPVLVVCIMLVSLCQMLDATIANVALPHMRAQLGAAPDQISWVLTSFMISLAIATPITGWLADRIGSRQLFLGATALFLLASAACGAASSLTAMIAFRVVQGIAAAFLGPMAQTALFDITPRSQQGTTMGYFSMVVMLAPITGPALGGILTEYLSWRWIFYVNLPLGIPALIGLWLYLPARPIERRRLDFFGFSMIGIGLAAMQLALDRGQHKDWLESWEIIIEVLIAISAAWIYIVHTRSTPEPLFRRELFSNKPFLFGLAFMVVMGFSVIGISAILPMMFQSIYGYPVIDSGLMMAPRGLGVMATSMICGWLMRRFDVRWIIMIGYLIAAYGMWTMTGWSFEIAKTEIFVTNLIQGLGLGLIFAPMNILAFSTLGPQLRPDGASLLALARSLGGSIGISIIITVLSRSQQVSHADVASHVTNSSIPGFDISAIIDRLGSLGAGVTMMIDGEVNRQALMIAFLNCFLALAVWLAVFAPLPFLLKKMKPTTVDDPPILHE